MKKTIFFFMFICFKRLKQQHKKKLYEMNPLNKEKVSFVKIK